MSKQQAAPRDVVAITARQGLMAALVAGARCLLGAGCEIPAETPDEVMGAF